MILFLRKYPLPLSRSEREKERERERERERTNEFAIYKVSLKLVFSSNSYFLPIMPGQHCIGDISCPFIFAV